MNCPFCNITSSEQNRVLEERKYVTVIFSNPRLMKAHLLVVPKRHIEKPSDLNNEERKELFDTVLEYQDKIVSKIASGCDIKENYRPFQSESELKVKHIHFHLQPRELYDELYKKVQIFETDLFEHVNEVESDIIELLKG